MILEKIRWCAVSKFIQLETGSAWFFSSFSRPDTLYYILWNTLHYFNRCTHHKLIKSGSQYFHKFSLLVESPSFLLLVLHMAYNACCKQQSTPLCCVTIQLLSNCLVTIIPLHPSQLQEINIKKIIKIIQSQKVMEPWCLHQNEWYQRSLCCEISQAQKTNTSCSICRS